MLQRIDIDDYLDLLEDSDSTLSEDNFQRIVGDLAAYNEYKKNKGEMNEYEE